MCQDIETFVKKYVSKFDSKLEPAVIIQTEINDIKDIKYITSEFLEEIFDVKISSGNGKYTHILFFYKIGNENKIESDSGLNNIEINESDSDNEEDDYFLKEEIKIDHKQDYVEDDINYYNVYVKNNNIPFKKGKRKYIDVIKSPIEFLYEKQFESKNKIKK